MPADGGPHAPGSTSSAGRRALSRRCDGDGMAAPFCFGSAIAEFAGAAERLAGGGGLESMSGCGCVRCLFFCSAKIHHFGMKLLCEIIWFISVESGFYDSMVRFREVSRFGGVWEVTSR